MAATLLAKTEELNSGNARFNGDMRSTTMHHTMDFKKGIQGFVFLGIKIDQIKKI